MSAPVIGFAGMTHLGLVSAIAVAAKGFRDDRLRCRRRARARHRRRPAAGGRAGLDELARAIARCITFTSRRRRSCALRRRLYRDRRADR